MPPRPLPRPQLSLQRPATLASLPSPKTPPPPGPRPASARQAPPLPSGPPCLFSPAAALATAEHAAESDFRAFVAGRSCRPSLRSHAAHALPSAPGAAPAGPSLPQGRACPGAETPHPEAPRAEEASPGCCLCPRVGVAPELSVPAARPSENHALLKSPPLPLLGPSSV